VGAGFQSSLLATAHGWTPRATDNDGRAVLPLAEQFAPYLLIDRVNVADRLA